MALREPGDRPVTKIRSRPKIDTSEVAEIDVEDQRSEQARIGSLEVLRDSLEDLLHRACQPRKEDNAALAAMQQSVFPSRV